MSAVDEISAGDLLMSVPLESIFTHLQFDGSTQGLSEEEILLLAILKERKRGNKSEWFVYIQSLPEREFVLASWHDSDLKLLVDDELRRRARSKSEEWERLQVRFSRLSGIAIELHDVRWVSSIVSSRSCFLESTGWSDLGVKVRHRKRAKVHTAGVGRTYDNSGVGVLIPLVDMFNHSNDECATAGYNPVSRRFEIKSTRNYTSGEQVFIHYGHLSNAQLLENWGFVIERNPNEVVKINYSELFGSKSMDLTKPDLVHAANRLVLRPGQLSKQQFEMSDPSEDTPRWDPFTWELLVLLQLMALELNKCHCARSDLIEELAQGGMLCSCTEQYCTEVIKNAIAQRLEVIRKAIKIARRKCKKRSTDKFPLDASFPPSSETAPIAWCYVKTQQRILSNLLHHLQSTL